jgi:hypothetical protein
MTAPIPVPSNEFFYAWADAAHSHSPSVGTVYPLQAPNRVNLKECDEENPDESAV